MAGGMMTGRRMGVATLLTAMLVAVGCLNDRKVPKVDSTGAAPAIDSAPASVVSGVAAVLSDQNVVALIDTAYRDMVITDTLAQAHATNQNVREFARRETSEDNLVIHGATSVMETHDISGIVPNSAVIKNYPDAWKDLRGKSGADFDKAFLDRTIDDRKAMLDHVNDALGSGQRPPGLHDFLTQLKTKLQGEVQTAQQLRGQVK